MWIYSDAWDWLLANAFTAEDLTAIGTVVAAIASSFAAWGALRAAKVSQRSVEMAEQDVEDRSRPQIVMVFVAEPSRNDSVVFLEIHNYGGVATEVKFSEPQLTPESYRQENYGLSIIQERFQTAPEFVYGLDVLVPGEKVRIALGSSDQLEHHAQDQDSILRDIFGGRGSATIRYSSHASYRYRGKNERTTCLFRLDSVAFHRRS